jgi:prepilin-type processing-associated H-X9-DG protein/prepilin-type N-terminal cleavage/methylation domain-containing protein
MRRRTAFTLVELLVVIGIIALLIGILMPVLGRAREQGRQTLCLSNIRQFATANQMYGGEYKGWNLAGYWGWTQASGGWPASTPPVPAADTPRRYWFNTGALAGYLAVKNSNPEGGRYPVGLLCPNNKLSFERATTDGYTIHNSYSSNYTDLPGMAARLAPAYWNAWRMNEVISPSEKVQFCDGTSEGVSVYGANAKPNSTIRYFDPYYGGETHEPPDKGGAVAYRHSKGANVAYYDGHAGWAPMTQLAYDPADANTTVNYRQWRPKVK